MTTDNATQLSEFETAGKPTCIDDLTVESPTKVIDAFDDVTPFKTAVSLNDHETPYLVGRRVDNERGVYHLYHRPTDPHNHAYAGQLGLKRLNDPPVVGFVPAGDEKGEETIAETVTSISITSRDEFNELDAILDHVKTELTGKDWVTDGRARTDYGEWIDAVLALYRFYDNDYENPPFNMTQAFLKGATMHAIARYPGGASKLLSSASMQLSRLEDNDDSDRYSITPFSLERLLLDYAAANVDTDGETTDE